MPNERIAFGHCRLSTLRLIMAVAGRFGRLRCDKTTAPRKGFRSIPSSFVLSLSLSLSLSILTLFLFEDSGIEFLVLVNEQDLYTTT